MKIIKLLFGFKTSVILLLGLSLHVAYGARTYTKYWAVANIIGPISKNSSFKYYLEPQLRLIDTPSVFNQFLFLGGLGYEFTPDLMFFAGPGWVYIKSTNGTFMTERRYWQQFNWRAVNTSSVRLNSRTRLEERSQSGESHTAYRLRQRLWLRLPFKRWKDYSFSTYDELFFNLNHPRWVSPYSFEQNRAFIGIGKQLTKSAIIDFGYLRQYVHSRRNQSDNVLLFSFTMIT